VVTVFAQAWHVEDEQIRARRDFAETENNLHPDNQDVFLSVEGMLGDTLRVSTPWDTDPRAPLILQKALVQDLDVRAVLLREGFKTIVIGDRISMAIPPMPKPVHHDIKKNAKPGSNPYPIEG
jgi:hypothetical protein